HHAQPPRRALAEPPPQVRLAVRGELRPLLAGGPYPAAQPLGDQRRLAGAEPPRARLGPYGEAPPAERLARGRDRVGAEQAAPGVLAPLVVVERGLELAVERVGRVELDPPGDRDGQQRGAGRRGAGGGERVDLAGGEQVEQG